MIKTKIANKKRSDTAGVVRRQFEMLAMIPPRPRKCTVEELTRRLADKGYTVDKRTVQRSLVNLRESGFGVIDDDGNPRGWSRESAQALNLDLHTALTLKLAYAYVEPLLPASIAHEMKALAESANKSLDGISNNLLAKWPNKIRVLSSGPPRTPPDVLPAVHSAVSEAMLKNLQLRVRYSARSSTEDSEYVVSPLGMVLKNGIIYLVVARGEKPNPFTLSLQRIRSAEIEHIDVKAPPGWKGLDTYIAQGGFLFPIGPIEHDCPVTLRFDSIAVQNIREIPLAGGQTIKEESTLAPNGKPYVLVKARVTISGEFVRWLLQYGDHVEVVKPAALRNQMREIVESLHTRYKKG